MFPPLSPGFWRLVRKTAPLFPYTEPESAKRPLANIQIDMSTAGDSRGWWGALGLWHEHGRILPEGTSGTARQRRFPLVCWQSIPAHLLRQSLRLQTCHFTIGIRFSISSVRWRAMPRVQIMLWTAGAVMRERKSTLLRERCS